MPLLDLLQLADSAFPSGSYAHSLGLETLYVTDDVDLEAHCRFVLANGLARVELPIVRAAWVASPLEPQGPSELRGGELAQLDQLMDMLLPVRELRMASRSIGRSFLRAASQIRPCTMNVEHHAVVFGAVMYIWGIGLDDGLELYAWQAIRQQLSAAQRLGKIGPSALQTLLDRLKPSVHAAVEVSRSITIDEAGGFAPLLDLAGMAHEHQLARLFLS